MPEQAPLPRRQNFDEVETGYSPQAAIDEAKRCIDCKTRPCVSGCPVNVSIPEFITKVAEGDFEGAYKIVSETNSLPAVCGRVCPQENQCERVCVRGNKGESVAIGRLERFVADWHDSHARETADKPPPAVAPEQKHRVAVVGSGPAGLACAGDLLGSGCAVTVFESSHRPGGVLVYGIPDFRLPKDTVDGEIGKLKARGAEFRVNEVIGKSLTLGELFDEGFKAVFIGSGAGTPRFLGIPGENLLGVISANEYLTRINLMRAHLTKYDTPLKPAARVAVIGGGNVAMDAARTAGRLGVETVTIVYRRSMNELPARVEEIRHALEEGIIFKTLTNPLEVLGDDRGCVRGLYCAAMQLGEPDESGRARPVEIPGASFILECDTVIVAAGTDPNPLISMAEKGLETDRWGCIKTDENMATSLDRVYAGGDAVTGAATVIQAMGAGKIAAKSIKAQLTS